MLKDKALHKLLGTADRILVGISGGPDSVVLLQILKKLKFKVYAAHLNHRIRGKAAQGDAVFVENFCKKLGVSLVIKSINVPAFAQKNKLSLEAAARKCRYSFLEKAAREVGANKIALGHNADDNLETFIMRLMRGTGLRGMAGIPPAREIPNSKSKITIIRPLLRIWRKEIEGYCRKHKLKYRIDKSNFDTKYFRNKVRHEIVAKMSFEAKEKILKSIAETARNYAQIEKTCQTELKKLIKDQNKEKLVLDPKPLKQIPDVLKSEVIRLAIERVRGNLTDIEFVHIRDIIYHLGNTETWKLNLPEGVKVIGDRNTITITNVDLPKPVKFKYRLKIPGVTEILGIGAKIESKILNKSQFLKFKIANGVYLDYNRTGKILYVRNWQPGDKFQPFGRGATKKLSDYFVDQKIPLAEKFKIPLIVNDRDQIVCVGGRLDERFKLDSQTKQVLNLKL